MGFFSSAYIVEGKASGDAVTFSVSAYRADGPTLFSWGTGDRAAGLVPLAGGTLFCATPLQPLPGYPRVDRRAGAEASEPGFHYVEESFFPYHRDDPVLFHIVLPPGYVLRPDREPFTLSRDAHIAQRGDQLVVTWPRVGGADLRFWIARLGAKESLADYDLGRLLTAPSGPPPKVSFELNLGIVKVKVG
jgi:hypothetical protein